MDCLILTIDVGNTNIFVGLYKDNELLTTFRLKTDKNMPEDQYFSLLFSLCLFHNINLKDVKICALSSVVPPLTEIITKIINKYLKCHFINVTAKTNLGLTFTTKNPTVIGADLIVNAYAAKEKYKKNCIICDFGTATTVQLIDKKGNFWGANIIPGVITASNNLFSQTSLLNRIKFKNPKNLLGTSTEEALLSGIIKGNALMIDGFVTKINQEFFELENIITIATGGISSLISESSEKIDIVDKELILWGLYDIAKKTIHKKEIM